MSALQRFIEIAFHSYEWGEMTLLEQADLHEQAAAELARKDAVIEAARDFVNEDGRGNPPAKYEALKATLKELE
jgi:hypothetical protein